MVASIERNLFNARNLDLIIYNVTMDELTEKQKKEICKKEALEFLKNRGHFPYGKEMQIVKGFTFSKHIIPELFGNHGNFKRFCGILDHTNLVSNDDITNYVKSKCKITGAKCWEWINCVTTYPALRVKGKAWRVSRLMYTCNEGSIPEGNVIRHKCDNKLCCNPDHLETGTYLDNWNDYLARAPKKKRKKKRHIRPRGIRGKEFCDWVEKLNKTKKPNECWEYPGPKATGYTLTKMGKRAFYVFRYMFCHLNKEDYDDKSFIVRHLCAKRYCVNPAHLAKGTERQNKLDCRAYSKATKLTENKVKIILRDMKKTDFSIKGSVKKFHEKWASKYSVSIWCIHNIRLGRSWSDLYEEILLKKAA